MVQIVGELSDVKFGAAGILPYESTFVIEYLIICSGIYTYMH